MKLTKKLSTAVVAMGFSALATVSQAATITVEGAIDNASGALASLAGPGTAFSGFLEWDAGTLTDGQVLLSGFCFTPDAVGAPPTSGTCGALSAVPMLPTGETGYDPAFNAGGIPAGTTFQQAGTTFDGNTGTLKLNTFSPTFNVPIFIDLVFNGDGTGTMAANAGLLGAADGAFTYSAVPVPAAAWLFGSGLIGLAGIGRKRNAA
jgi:hypothetical protein